MRIMLIYLIAGNKEGNAGDYDEDDRGKEGLAHVEGQLPLRCHMKTAYIEEKNNLLRHHMKHFPTDYNQENKDPLRHHMKTLHTS